MPKNDFERPDLPLAELFAEWPECAAVFWQRKMKCPGCPFAPFHTISEACEEYLLEEEEFRAELRQVAFGDAKANAATETKKNRSL